MDKFIKIELIDNTPKLTCSDDLSYIECVAITLHQLHIFLETMAQTTVSKIKEEHPEIEDEEANKQIRANIYDKVVMMFSEKMNIFFPEAEELDKRTPEELLEALDAKVQELNELNKQDAVSE